MWRRWAPFRPACTCRIRPPPTAWSSTGRDYSRRSSNKYVGPGIEYSSALVNPDLGLYGQTSTGQAGGAITPVRFEENPGYWMASLAGGYAFKLPKGSFAHSLKIKVEIDNLFNHKVQFLSGVGSTAASDAYYVLPTTDYFVTFSAEF